VRCLLFGHDRHNRDLIGGSGVFASYVVICYCVIACTPKSAGSPLGATCPRRAQINRARCGRS
jgi:hypothetical protein